MNKKNLLILLILLLCLENSLISVVSATTITLNLPCTCNDTHKTTEIQPYSQEVQKWNFWTDDNINLLNPEQKTQLNSLEEKINSGNRLTASEIELMCNLKDVVFKAKLGEERFIQFKNIINKKKSGEKLTPTEIHELKSYFQEVRGE